jgi:hypothetical protein
MRPSLAAASLVLLAALPRAARAEPVVALRLAIAPAVGSTVDDVPVSDGIRFQFPVQLDALWAAGPLAVGGYGSWGAATVGACSGSCSASVVRAGVQATWTLPPLRSADPWLGAGLGYEWATERRERAGHEVTTRWRGLELPSLQGGLEWRVARAFAIGPFLLVGVGRYARMSLDTGVDSASSEISGKAFHAWIHLGVRGRLALGGSR